jgi:ABC-type spermidine/putrescine transport system permease subunit II
VRKAANALLSGILAVVLVSAVVVIVVTLAAMLRGDMTPGRAVGAAVAASVLALVLRLVPAPRLLAGYSALVYVILFAPIVVVIIYAFNGGTSVTVFERLSFRWFGEALGDVTITSAVERSARIALLSSMVSVTVGTAAAIFLARAQTRVRLPVEGVVLLAVVVPELVIAISLLLFFVDGGFALGDATMVISHSLFGTAVVVLIVRSRYASMGRALEQASADLGAGFWATLRQVTLPPLAPAILAGGLLAFTFSFDDVVGSQFTSGAGNQTWPLRILGALRFGLKPDINATATMMLGVTAVGLVAAGLLLRAASRRQSGGAHP